jgi:hypothetical protein
VLVRITFPPGAVVNNTNINLPSWAPKIDTIASARLLRHIAVQIDATATGADKTSFVGLLDGAGNAVSNTFVAHPGSAQADISVPAAITAVSATATKVDEDTIKLNVDTIAGDDLELVYIPVGSRLRVS